MKRIIPAIKKELLLSELTRDKFLRNSNFGNNEIYLFDGRKAPYLMQELGRLRELTFRKAGGGTGLTCDIDKYDLADDPYFQLIVWDPKEHEIAGGYRYILGESTLDNPNDKLATSHLFNLSTKFITNYLPKTIELGRSFIQPAYQPKYSRRKGLFLLDNLWDGLGALIMEYPDIEYFFGKVTMYKNYNVEARNYLLTFLHLYLPDTERLVNTKNPIEVKYNKYDKIFINKDYNTGYIVLMKKLREYGEKIPPLINAYMNLSSASVFFGTAENDEFGGVEETGILLDIKQMYKEKRERYTKKYESYIKINELLPRKPKTFNENLIND
jgi:hypothetical protein